MSHDTPAGPVTLPTAVPTSPSRPVATLQMLAGAAERIQRRLPGSLDQDDLAELVERARERLAESPFAAEPLRGICVRGKGKTRVAGMPSLVERVIEEAVRPRLERTLEALLSDAVHGYRPGRSALTASHALRAQLAAGRLQVVSTDIAAFFPSVPHAEVQRLVSAAWPDLAELLMSLVSAPVMLRGVAHPTTAGLPLGRAISPYLSNLVLLEVDERMLRAHAQRVGYVRYADDLVLAAEHAEHLELALATLDDALAPLGLRRSLEKTRFVDAAQGPVRHLGHFVDAFNVFVRRVDQPRRKAPSPAPDAVELVAGSAVESVGLDTPAPAFRRVQTLYVTTNNAYLAIHNASVVVRNRQQVLAQVPLHRLDRIVIIAHVGMSSGFASACIGHRIPVTFVVGKGRAFGSLSAGGPPNPLRLRAQYDLVARREVRVELARAIVAAKIEAMIRRLKNVTSAQLIRAELKAHRDALGEYTTPESLRGVEGITTKRYYEGFAARIMSAAFAFRSRTRRPPRDAINSLMSFAYTLLFSEMQSSLLAHGLDPHPALLHDLHRNHPALASDLTDPYRVLVADTFVLTLVNQRRVAPDGFTLHPQGAVLMTDATRHTVLEAFEAFMMAPLGGSRGSVSPRRLIDAAASAMLRVVLGEEQTLILPLGGAELDNIEGSLATTSEGEQGQ